MRRRQWANLACVSALALALGTTATFAEGTGSTDPTLGIPLPEQPALVILDDEKPATEKARAAAQSGSEAAPDAQSETATIPEPGMVTGMVAPSAQPHGSLAAPELPSTPAATPGVADEPVTLDIPEIELPPSDPALIPSFKTQSTPEPLRSAEPLIAPPDLPKVVVDLPAGSGFAADIAARATEALALPRLAERERTEILAA